VFATGVEGRLVMRRILEGDPVTRKQPARLPVYRQLIFNENPRLKGLRSANDMGAATVSCRSFQAIFI
jgi:hypothetical protein